MIAWWAMNRIADAHDEDAGESIGTDNSVLKEIRCGSPRTRL